MTSSHAFDEYRNEGAATDMRTAALKALSVLLLVLGSAPVLADSRRSAGGKWEAGPELYGTVSVTDVSIVMDDGAALVGDVIYPAQRGTSRRAEGKFPVLLNQTPYFCGLAETNLDMAQKSAWDYFVKRGYILASVCVRGAGRSSGIFDIWSARSAQDGVRLVDWAAHRLEGSNEKVGLIGCSYHGAMQSLTASALSPGSPVKAMAPFCTGAEAYRVTFFSGGMPTQTFNWLLAAFASMGAPAGEQMRLLASDIMEGADRAYDREFWERRTPGFAPDRIVRNGIPALFWTGYADEVTVTGTLEFVAALQNAYFGRDPRAAMRVGQPGTGRYQIVVGSGAHGRGFNLATQLKWYDTWLKGRNTGMADTSSPFHLWMRGQEAWVDVNSYPLLQRYTSYQLNNDGRLTAQRPDQPGGVQIRYTQPDRPGGSAVFTSAPLQQGAVFAGPASATLWVSSSSTNAQIIATLEEVAPDQTVRTLTRGSVVASLRELDPHRTWTDEGGTPIRPYGTFDRDQYLTPDLPVRLDIALDPRTAQIAPGYALRLVLTTQTPAAKCSQSLGTDPCFPTVPQRETLPGVYTVHSGADMPSALHLPLAAFDAYRASVDGASWTGD